MYAKKAHISSYLATRYALTNYTWVCLEPKLKLVHRQQGTENLKYQGVSFLSSFFLILFFFLDFGEFYDFFCFFFHIFPYLTSNKHLEHCLFIAWAQSQPQLNLSNRRWPKPSATTTTSIKIPNPGIALYSW